VEQQNFKKSLSRLKTSKNSPIHSQPAICKTIPMKGFRYRFPSHQSSDIVCNADMRLGKIPQFCGVVDDG